MMRRILITVVGLITVVLAVIVARTLAHQPLQSQVIGQVDIELD